MNNFALDAQGHPGMDVTITYNRDILVYGWANVSVYLETADGTKVWAPYTISTIANTGSYPGPGYTEHFRKQFNDPVTPGTSWSDVTGVWVAVRDEHGNYVATADVPWANIKPIWNLKVDYTCAGPNGSVSAVQDGGSFDSPTQAPTTTPSISCQTGSYVTAWRSHILGPNGDHTLMQWAAPAALTNASGPYADCLRLAGGQGCDLQHGTVAGSPVCYWGTHQVPLSDCDFQETLDSIRGRVRVQNWGYTAPYDAAEEAYTAADQCLIVASAADCQRLPMFMPGYDVKEAAQHDAQAILTGGKPAKLTWAPDTSRALPGWYNSDPICMTKPSGTNCDEYPFRSTMEGGPGASLKAISATDNQREGTLLLGFYSVCGIPANPPFLVVPVVPPTGDSIKMPSMAFCGPGA